MGRSTQDGGDNIRPVSDAGTQAPGRLNCLAQGTLIATKCGEIAVERIAIGDRIVTGDGGSTPVTWVGTHTIVTAFAGERARLIRIAAKTLGNHSDLLVTGCHGLFIKGQLYTASSLVNGTTITVLPLADTPDRFTVYRLLTEGGGSILANGARSQISSDLRAFRCFDNHEEYVALYGDPPHTEDAPMWPITSARYVPDDVWADLALGLFEDDTTA